MLCNARGVLVWAAIGVLGRADEVCEDGAALEESVLLQSGVHDLQSSQGAEVFVRQQDVLADEDGNPRHRPGVRLGLEQRGSSMVLEAIAAKGGLIQTFELNKRNILYNRPLLDQMDGSTFWPGPQQAWGWPPPEQIDPTPSGKYDLSYSLEIYQRRYKAFTLTSSVAQSVNLQVSKTISMDPGRSAAVLDYAITNTGNQARSWAPWEIGRVRPHGLTFYMTGASPPTSGTWPALHVVQAGGATWFQQTGAGGKLFADTAEGWLAHTDGELVWVKCFEKIAPGKEAPGENQIEIYDGGDYVEVEQQGAYEPIYPQRKLHWRVLWFLREMPPGARATPGNPELLKLARSLCG